MKVVDRMGGPDFADVYEKWYDRIYKYAYTILLNREDAEDVTADTFLTAYEIFDSYDEKKASVGTWLSRIVHNRAVNLLRSSERAKRTQVPEDWEYAAEVDFTEQVEASETLLWLYARILPEERELLNLRCVLQMRDVEIGELLELPEKTVNKRYHRLLDKCRKILDEKDG